MILGTIVLGLVLLWFLSNLFSLFQNYYRVRNSGLPIIITPINPDNLIWLVFNPALHPYAAKYLPTFLYHYLKPTFYGWEIHDRYEYTELVGKTFLLVTPGQVECRIADPAVSHVVLSKWKLFPSLPISSKILGLCGPNLFTADGDVWTRQRRLIAPNLNERISSVVWSESYAQSQDMAKYLVAQKNGETENTLAGLRSIALGVLGQAGYGQRLKWSIGAKGSNGNSLNEKIDEKRALFDAVSLMIDNLVIAALIPIKTLQLPFMPKQLQTLGKTRERFPEYSHALLESERRLAARASEPRQNMAAMLARLSEDDDEQDFQGKPNVSSQYLTPKEISGNLFVFTAAGFDTTANTMAYAVTLLAAYPEWQTWIQEELDTVFVDVSADEEADYTTTFPRLEKCLAVMFETLRIFPPVTNISRSTVSAQSINTDTLSFIIPANVKVYINNVALHSYPSLWGTDSLTFRPTRWLLSDGSFLKPERGSWNPWSGGPRTCPGQKMAQVEFVAVLASLFHKMKVEAVASNGDNADRARQRLVELMADSAPGLTLQIKRPKDVKLRWSIR